MARGLALAGVGVSGLTAILVLVALVTNSWLVTQVFGNKIVLGLFTYCFNNDCQAVDYDDALGNAVRVLECAAFACMALACVFAVLFVVKESGRFVLVAGGLAAVSVLCGIISVAVFASKSDTGLLSIGTSYGYGFYLAAVSIVLAAASAVTFLALHKTAA